MPPEEKPETRPKRRRWKRWVLGLLVLLGAFLVWANGPGLRWALTKVINSQLEAQQLSGHFEVRGTALSGVSLHEISLSGPGLIQSVESDLLRLQWSLSSLLDQEVESLTLEKLHLVIDPAAAPPSSDDESTPDEEATPKPLSETLNLVRRYVQPTQISLTDLKVEVVAVTRVSLDSLTHDAGSSNYLIEGLKGQDHLGRPLNNPRTTLTWTEDGFTADQLTLLPNLALQDLLFHPGKAGKVDLVIDGRRIHLTSNLQSAHQLKLLSPIPLSTLADVGQLDLPLSGTITTLDLDTSDGRVALEIEDLSYQDQSFASASLRARSPSLLSPMDQPVTFSLALDDRVALDGTVTPTAELLDSSADLNFTVRWPEIPEVTGELAYDSREARVLASALDSLRVTGRYQVDARTYRAEAVADLKEAGTLHPTLRGPLSFTAKAAGDLVEATHTGTLNLTELNLRQPDLPEATSSGTITWDWPQRVAVEQLTMTSPEGQLEARLAWQDETLEVTRLDLSKDDNPLLSATASIPASLEMRSLDDFLDTPKPLALEISSQPLSFQTLSAFAPLPKDLTGVVQADLKLGGTPAEPSLDGFATLDDFRVTTRPKIPPVAVDLNFKTADQNLTLTALAEEPRGPLLDLKGTLPFLPRAWLDRTADPASAPISLTAKTPDLDLVRLKPFLPEIISQLQGSLNLDLAVAGTLAQPDLTGSTQIRIRRMRLEESPISDFRDTTLTATFAKSTVTIKPSPINASGGDAELRGTIDLATPEPTLNLSLKGKYILLYRTPDFTFRGHPDLRLTGPFSEATLSGNLKIVESLIYKDIEILPLGVPRTTDIPKPNLPSFSARPQPLEPDSKPASGPKNWKLNIAVNIEDPVLIRGNLARGQINGGFRVGGTIGDPTTKGTLTSEDLVADLPFSNLEVQTGVLTLRPSSLTNPLINLRGSSKIGQYLVQVYLSGSVKDPKLVLTSDPPMPESEILLLLATGSASDQLADQQLASQKALQYIFEALRRRNRDKDKSVLQRLIKNSDQIELSLGDTNQFSGRRFSSATLEIEDQWDFTTQIDQQGQTRALVIFSIRFK